MNGLLCNQNRERTTWRRIVARGDVWLIIKPSSWGPLPGHFLGGAPDGYVSGLETTGLTGEDPAGQHFPHQWDNLCSACLIEPESGAPTVFKHIIIIHGTIDSRRLCVIYTLQGDITAVTLLSQALFYCHFFLWFSSLVAVPTAVT